MHANSTIQNHTNPSLAREAPPGVPVPTCHPEATPSSTLERKLRPPLLLGLSLAAALVSCGKGPPPAAAPKSPEAAELRAQATVHLPAAATDAVGIKMAKAEMRESRSALRAVGKILAPQTHMAIVSYFLPGRVAQVHVQAGDSVKKGQPLVTLECAEVCDGMSEFYKAVASLELAQLSLERERGLADRGVSAKKTLLAAEADHKVAQVTLEAAEKRLHILGFTEEQVQHISQTHQVSPAITLNSPLTGKVATSKAIVGGMVDPSKEILTVLDPKLLWVDAETYEKDLARIKLGQAVEVVVPAYPALRFVGQVRYISDVVNEETRTITVRTEVANPDDRLKPGMFADVEILYDTGRQVLTVPVNAILEDGSQPIVFVREKDGFARREIETGPINGTHRQVVKGLREGEEVVVEGNHQLKSKLSEAILRGGHMH